MRSEITLDNREDAVYTFHMTQSQSQRALRCRHCDAPCAPNLGYGHINVCTQCVHLEVDVPLVRAGLARDESGTEWDIGWGRAGVLDGAKALRSGWASDDDRTVRTGSGWRAR